MPDRAKSQNRRYNEGAEDAELGRQIRALRKGRSLTLKQFAVEVGVSVSLISQVERGLASPSIGTVRRMAKALDIPIAALFGGGSADPAGSRDRHGHRLVVRAGGHRSLDQRSGEGVLYELLAPDIDRRVEFLRMTLDPGARSPAEPDTHFGDECHLCTVGRYSVVLDGDVFDLAAGDTIAFDAVVPHHVENRGSEPAVVIIALNPPTF